MMIGRGCPGALSRPYIISRAAPIDALRRVSLAPIHIQNPKVVGWSLVPFPRNSPTRLLAPALVCFEQVREGDGAGAGILWSSESLRTEMAVGATDPDTAQADRWAITIRFETEKR